MHSSSIQANDKHAPGNAPNDESHLTVENSTPNVDHTDALSETSGQQPPGASFGSTPVAVLTYMGHTV